MNQKRFQRFGSGILFLLLLGLPLGALAQCPLTLKVTHTPVQQLSINDIDFEHFQSTALLFTMNIGNTSASPANAILEVTVDIRLADGSSFLPAVQYKSLPFAVKAGGQTFTNLDMGTSATVIRTDQFTYDSKAKDRFDDIVLGTGLFPAGRYSFSIRVTCDDGTGAKDDRFVLILRNASRIELRSPKDAESTNQFPLFEYFTDATDVQLIVGELMPGDSRQDAINRQPAMLSVDLRNQNSYFYAGGRPLEQGKSYVWQVIGKSMASGGSSSEIKSEIRKFTVTGTAITEDELLRRIEEALGPKYKRVFDDIRNGKYTLTGRYSNNNVPLTAGELLNLVNELRDALDGAEVTFE